MFHERKHLCESVLLHTTVESRCTSDKNIIQVLPELLEIQGFIFDWIDLKVFVDQSPFKAVLREVKKIIYGCLER